MKVFCNFRTADFRKNTALRLFILMSLILILCIFTVPVLADEIASGTEEISGTEEDDTAPNLKNGAPKKHLCLVSYDEYILFSRQLYYILNGLMENGWILENSIPFTIEEIENQKMYVDEMYKLLQETDLGPYLEFSPDACYNLAYEAEDAIAADLKKRAKEEDIDLIITTGTRA